MKYKDYESNQICAKCKFGVSNDNETYVCGCSAEDSTTSNELATMGCECIRELYLDFEYNEIQDFSSNTDIE